MTVDLAVVPDRGHSTPELGVGFDTIAVTGPTDLDCLNELQRIYHRRFVDEVTGEIRDSLPGGKGWVDVGEARAKVAVYTDGSHRTTMRVEISAPRMLEGHNWDAIELDQLESAVDYLLRGVGESLPDVPELDQVRVTRLDLTRDFHHVRDPSATLASIGTHPVNRATLSATYQRPSDRSVQTLVVGNRHYWQVRGYDKAHQALTTASVADRPGVDRMVASRPSQLRFEVELKSKELRRLRLTSVASLTRTDLHQLARSYFERCNFDVSTASTSTTEILNTMEADGVKLSERKNLLLYLTCLRTGTSPLMGRNALQRSRTLAKRYRLGPDSLGSVTFERRLDFDQGREVVE